MHLARFTLLLCRGSSVRLSWFMAMPHCDCYRYLFWRFCIAGCRADHDKNSFCSLRLSQSFYRSDWVKVAACVVFLYFGAQGTATTAPPGTPLTTSNLKLHIVKCDNLVHSWVFGNVFLFMLLMDCNFSRRQLQQTFDASITFRIYQEHKRQVHYFIISASILTHFFKGIHVKIFGLNHGMSYFDFF